MFIEFNSDQTFNYIYDLIQSNFPERVHFLLQPDFERSIVSFKLYKFYF